MEKEDRLNFSEKNLDKKKVRIVKELVKRDTHAEDEPDKDDLEGVEVIKLAVPTPLVSASEFVEKVVAIKRVTKVTKGGKKLSFSALVVVGDGKGKVGYNLGKASEVATAIKKALNSSKKNMMTVSLRGTTIPHEIIGKCGSALVMLKPASEGTGVIAAGPVRAVCDGVGIRNILTKCHRSNNPINIIKATFDGLSRLKRMKRPDITPVNSQNLQEGKTEKEV